MMHHVIYLGSVGTSGYAPRASIPMIERLRSVMYQHGHSYEVALAARQSRVYAPVLTELGFERKMVSTNPNSGRRIEGWFKSVK